MENKYIFFDLDGTLTESGPGIINSVSYALNRLGVEVKDKDELKKFIGPPLLDSMMQFYGMTEEEAERGIAYYREYYTEKGIFENTVYGGITEALGKLKEAGKVLAVSTSKPEVFARRIAEHFSFDCYFDTICGAALDGSRVNKADVIQYTLETLGIAECDRGKVLMVGDREHDILGAKKNGVASMGVLYGYGNRLELEEAGADYIIDVPAELPAKILGGGIQCG